MIIAENALSIPMNLPLGLALTDVIAETNLPTIAHHHDFAWERVRYKRNSVEDLLRGSFPPALPSITHVVISHEARQQLALRTGASSFVIPNVMDFSTPPAAKNSDRIAALKASLGIPPDHKVLLQPTRIVPRKKIEKAIEIASMVKEKATLLISHEDGDEGTEYQKYLERFAKHLGVHLVFGASQISRDGKDGFTLKEAYDAADLVTYPSSHEGFGNAFVEAMYFRKPLVMRNYSVFRQDILPKGFDVLVFDEFISEGLISKINELFDNGGFFDEIADHNYALGQHYFSYDRLYRNIMALLWQ